ncbi:uncharacterized protein LOC143246103 [Tachypleus tridentatus]|uniref:uncharacterized protein LOC143246103 n=1 Tax=Tachypleus tridentatus TaxID=6853 RepID=UPI003FD4B6A5
MMELVLLLTLVLGSRGQTTHEGCDGSEFATCMNQSFSVNSESPVGGLAGSLKDLELSCRKFYKGMECMERFHEQCRNSAKFMDYIEKQIEGARAAMFHLCHNEATIQEENKVYNTCYRELNTDIIDCIKPLQQQPRYSHKKIVKNLCCALNRTVDCILEAADKACSQKAAHVARQMVRVVTSSLEVSCTSLVNKECSGTRISLFFGSNFAAYVLIFCFLIF